MTKDNTDKIEVDPDMNKIIGEVKVLLLYSTAQLNQMVSVALYNLTPGRGLT